MFMIVKSFDLMRLDTIGIVASSNVLLFCEATNIPELRESIDTHTFATSLQLARFVNSFHPRDPSGSDERNQIVCCLPK